MTLITKPDFSYIWASGGAIVAPNDTKKQQGWVAEAPPFQYDNWLQNRQDQMLAHINQRGIPAWDGLTNYEAGGLSYAQGSDGKIYKSVAASGPSATVQNPVTDVTDVYWTIAFADVGAFLDQTAGDARYTQRASNLSDVTNAATARTNLGVYSTSQSDELFPVGSVVALARSTAPTGYLKANGALVSRTTYATLFTAIGTTWGVGDGSTTFALPDLRGEFIRGWDDGRGIDAGRVFGSLQLDEFKSHTHTVTAQIGTAGGAPQSSGSGTVNPYTTNATGGAETRPRNVALLYCIKY